MEHINRYLKNIFERYTDLKKSKKQDLDNNDLWKIFEYYSCIKLSEEYKKPFYEYDDIEPSFKELNKMSRNDTGIDCSDLIDTIVQCKLRKNTLTWKDCATFFGSQVIFSAELKKPIVRWEHMIITRNKDCILSENLLERKELFIDKPYVKQQLIDFCENLILNPPKYPVVNNDFKLRDYQTQAIRLIEETKKNVIINLPTGTGKNSVIIYSFRPHKKYLILVPRIILMDQLKKEIIKHKPNMKNKIQVIGDGNDTFNENKQITICVFNSIHLIEPYCMNFEKIFIDEAHHINKPAIYYENNDGMDEGGDDEEVDEDIDNRSDEYFDDDNSIDTENITDDSEDELVNVKSYTQIIKSLVQYNNNVYLSATIDPIDEFEYYSRDIRTMIDLKYLSDYQIHVPIFNDDPTNKNICEHLLKNYRNIIIYCNSQKEGKQINRLINELQMNSSEYIDCNTPKKKRNMIIDKYKNGEMPFLVNVRILVEGFDAPITRGVCFMHLPTNKTTLIQIIGRCLRLHPTKTIANIILPFSSKEDEKSICNFLKVMAINDSRIRKSFENKTIGGYISIDNTIEEDDKENEGIEFKYNMIYNSMGVLQNGEDIWMRRLEDVKRYIDENKKRASSTDKNNNIRQIGVWTVHQIKNYKKKTNIMKNDEIYNRWTETINNPRYTEYFQSNEEQWYEQLEKVIRYIDDNKKQPSSIDKNNNIQQMGRWIVTQKMNYKKKTKIMKNDNIYNRWTETINNPQYIEYFQSKEELWNDQLNILIKCIDENKKRPSTHDSNKDIQQLAVWLSNQSKNYKNKSYIMKNDYIYNKWMDFINNPQYIEYFQSNEELWNEQLEKVIKYIDDNKKRPNRGDKNIQHMGVWLSYQTINYKKKTRIMKNDDVYNKWTKFINNPQYREYFQSNEEQWNEQLQKVIDYIDENKKLPNDHDNNNNIKQMGIWIVSQKINYKKKTNIMKNDDIYNKWCELINNPQYCEYFQSNEEHWNVKLQRAVKYIDDNKKKPNCMDKNNDVQQLGQWISVQKRNYIDKKNIMKIEEIYNLWKETITNPQYREYFQSNEEIWIEQLQTVIKYIDENKKRPNEEDKNKDIQKLGRWLSHQTTNYKKRTRIMKNEEIYNLWTEFINNPHYKEHFQSNEEYWEDQLEKVIKYIDDNKKKPTSNNKDKNIQQLGIWISTQITTYKKRTCIMKNEPIYNKWTETINNPQYKNYFRSDEELWNDNLRKVIEYIDENKKRPSIENTNKHIQQLGSWIANQTHNYKKITCIMKNEILYNKWKEFINSAQYKEHFQSNEELWNDNLRKVIDYIDENKKRPSSTDKKQDIKYLGEWLSNQSKNYKKKTNIMKNDDIYNKWRELINNPQYCEYFQSNIIHTTINDNGANIIQQSTKRIVRCVKRTS